MAQYVKDVGTLGGISQGLAGFFDAYSKAQEDKLKREYLKAQIASEKNRTSAADVNMKKYQDFIEKYEKAQATPKTIEAATSQDVSVPEQPLPGLGGPSMGKSTGLSPGLSELLSGLEPKGPVPAAAGPEGQAPAIAMPIPQMRMRTATVPGPSKQETNPDYAKNIREATMAALASGKSGDDAAMIERLLSGGEAKSQKDIRSQAEAESRERIAGIHADTARENRLQRAKDASALRALNRDMKIMHEEQQNKRTGAMIGGAKSAAMMNAVVNAGAKAFSHLAEVQRNINFNTFMKLPQDPEEVAIARELHTSIKEMTPATRQAAMSVFQTLGATSPPPAAGGEEPPGPSSLADPVVPPSGRGRAGRPAVPPPIAAPPPVTPAPAYTLKQMKDEWKKMGLSDEAMKKAEKRWLKDHPGAE